MFDFQKLDVYSKAKQYNKSINKFTEQNKLNHSVKDQLRRASLSIMLNIAEGSGRFTKRDKRNFYVIARGSTLECVAILGFLCDSEIIEESTFEQYHDFLEDISKMLFGLIRKLE